MTRAVLPPVLATTTASDLAMGALRRVTADHRQRVTAEIVHACNGRVAVLTDGATSALAQALRMVAAPGDTVALPDFGCVDLVAAARFAGVSVLTYDIDPTTLSPDEASVRRVLAAGIRALVVAPLLGFPLDYDAMQRLCRTAGVWLVEDAAQGAGGAWRGRRIGTFGDLVVLSFGRGKGTSAGRGGALVSRHADFDAGIGALATGLPSAAAGWRDWVVSAAVWALARPSLYAIPSSIPSLQLGAMVFHDAHAPRRMSDRALALLPAAVQRAAGDADARGAVAARLSQALAGARGTVLPVPLQEGRAGWLRLPLLDGAGRGAAPSLGILRSYPMPVRAMPEGRELMRDLTGEHPGADELARTLLTVPTHRFVTPSVVDQITAWAVG